MMTMRTVSGMTREEVIKELFWIKEGTVLNPEAYEALDISIKALEQISEWTTWSKTYENMVIDAISREAVFKICDRKDIRSALQVGREVQKLPSVHPEQNTIDLFNLTEEERQQNQWYVQGYADAVKERKKGKWVHRWSGCGSVWLDQKCSECGVVFEDEPNDYNYCPICGADMR